MLHIRPPEPVSSSYIQGYFSIIHIYETTLTTLYNINVMQNRCNCRSFQLWGHMKCSKVIKSCFIRQTSQSYKGKNRSACISPIDKGNLLSLAIV